MRQILSGFIIFFFIFSPLNCFSFERGNTKAKPETTFNPTQSQILDDFDTGTDFPLSYQEAEDAGQNHIFEFYVRTEVLSSCWLKDIKTPVFEEGAFRFANLKLSFDLNLKLKYQGWAFFSDLDINNDFAASLNGGSGYTEDFRDDMTKNVETKELWAEKSITSSVDIKAGRQIISWGVSNTLRLTDVLNPLDNRWTGMTDIEDRRLPVAMTRMNFYSEKTNLTLVAVHEVRKDKTPVHGSPFYLAGTGREVKKDASTFENTQFGLSLNRHFRGGDAGVYLAGFFDQDAYADMTTYNRGEYPFVKMAGAACTIARGDFLMKAETAFFKGKKYTGAKTHEKERFDLLAGLEYSGFKDTSLVMEIVNRHIFDFENQMEIYGFHEDDVSSVFKIEREFLNKTLVIGFLSSFGGVRLENGGFLRIKAEYAYTDRLKFESGFVFYSGGENRYYETIEDNDTFFFKMIFDFNNF